MRFHPDFNPPDFAEFGQGPSVIRGFRNAVLDLNPEAFYRFSEAQGSSQASDLTGQQPAMTHHGASLAGAPSSLPLDPDSALEFPATFAYSRSPITPPSTGDFTLLLRVRPGTQTSGFTQAFAQFDPPNATLMIRAEDYHAQTPGTLPTTWTLINEGSNGQSLQALPDTGELVVTQYSILSPRLDYSIVFNQVGTHYVWVYGRAGGQTEITSDSLHVGLNQAETPTSARIASFTNTSGWSNTTMDLTRAYVDIPSTGKHDLSVWMREDGFIFDRILITPDPDFDPTTDALPDDAISQPYDFRPVIAGYANGRLGPQDPGLHLSLLDAQDDLKTIRYQLGLGNQNDVILDLQESQWYSFALQKHGSQSKLFLDGVLVHTSSAGTLELSHPIDLGGSPRDNFDGMGFVHAHVDEFAYFDQALTPQSLLQLHRLASEA